LTWTATFVIWLLSLRDRSLEPKLLCLESGTSVRACRLTNPRTSRRSSSCSPRTAPRRIFPFDTPCRSASIHMSVFFGEDVSTCLIVYSLCEKPMHVRTTYAFFHEVTMRGSACFRMKGIYVLFAVYNIKGPLICRILKIQG
jgi:hypothetical protein